MIHIRPHGISIGQFHPQFELEIEGGRAKRSIVRVRFQ